MVEISNNSVDQCEEDYWQRSRYFSVGKMVDQRKEQVKAIRQRIIFREESFARETSFIVGAQRGLPKDQSDWENKSGWFYTIKDLRNTIAKYAQQSRRKRRFDKGQKGKRAKPDWFKVFYYMTNPNVSRIDKNLNNRYPGLWFPTDRDEGRIVPMDKVGPNLYRCKESGMNIVLILECNINIR